MRLAHRTVHRRAWHVLSIIVTLGVILALWLRPPPDQPEPAQPVASAFSSEVDTGSREENALFQEARRVFPIQRIGKRCAEGRS